MMQYKKRYIVVLLAILFVSSLPVLAEDNRRVYTRYFGTHEVFLNFVMPDGENNENEEVRQYRRYSGTHEVFLSFERSHVSTEEAGNAVERGDGAPISPYAEEERPRGDGATTAYVEEPRQEERGDGATTADIEEDIDINRRGDGATSPSLNAKEEPEAQPAPLVRRPPENVRIQSVKLLQVRETSRGGSLPFDTADIEEEISPKGIRENQTSSVNPVTCGNQRFPVGAGMTNSPIQFRFPDAGGACEIGLTVSNSAEIAFTITSISASSANVAGLNGWSANLSNISYGIGSTVASSITLSRNGVSYTIGIDAEGTGAGSFPIYINVTSFSGPN